MNDIWFPLLMFVGVPASFLILLYAAGSLSKYLHLGRLAAGERACEQILATNTSAFPAHATEAQIVLSEVVISTDHFRSLIARIRKIFGGELSTYRSMMMRARREAILRLQQQAMAGGFTGVANIRLEAADIRGDVTAPRKKRKLTAICSILASGTAYR